MHCVHSRSQEIDKSELRDIPCFFNALLRTTCECEPIVASLVMSRAYVATIGQKKRQLDIELRSE